MPQALNDDTKILTKTNTETFFPIPNFPKPKPIHFFRDQLFRNQNRYFFSETKFSETKTETHQKLANVSNLRSFETKCQSLPTINPGKYPQTQSYRLLVRRCVALNVTHRSPLWQGEDPKSAPKLARSGIDMYLRLCEQLMGQFSHCIGVFSPNPL